MSECGLDAMAESLGTDGDLDAAIVALVARGAIDLPVHPAVASQVEDLVRGGDYAMDRLARLVTADPALAAEALAAANAAAQDERHAAASVAQALERLDPRTLVGTALATVRRSRAAPGPLAQLRERAWRDALSCALLCRDLARVRGLPDDEAFTAGLLHDVGRPVAIAVLERLAQGAQHPRAMSGRWWEAVVDRYHVELGQAIARRWALPGRLADAIALHHADDVSAAADPELLAVVMTSDVVVRALADGTRVSADDAASIRALSEADAAALAHTAEALPAFLSSIERRAARASAAAPRRPAPPHRDARLQIAGVDYAIVGFAPHQIVLRGPVPLPEGLLLEVGAVREPGGFHARVLMCWPDGERFGAVIAPFALVGPAHLHWQGLVATRVRS